MQDVIAEAVFEGLQRVNVVSDRDRELFAQMYGFPVEEYVEEQEAGVEYDNDTYENYTVVRPVFDEVHPEEVPLGYDSGGSNADLTAVIVEALLANGDVPQAQGRKVYDAVLEALNSYPTTVVNGREQGYFNGSPWEFADELAPKIEKAMEKRGILDGVKKLLKLR